MTTKMARLSGIFLFFLTSLLFTTDSVKAAAVSSPYDNLTSFLLDGYSVHNPPTHKRPTNVSIGLKLHSITNLDEVLGVLNAVIWQALMWTDERLSWNPADHNGIEVLRLPADLIWKPDIILYNSVREWNPLSEVHAIAYPNGLVYYMVPITIESACAVDLYKYPYDKQTCTLIFGSWVHDDSKLSLSATDVTMDLSFYVLNPTWEITETTMKKNSMVYPCCPAETYEDVTASISLRRSHPDSHIASALFANWMILIVFLISPASSGERIIYSAFVFVALIVVSSSLNATVPRYTSTSVGRFVIFGLVLTGVVTAVTALCYTLYPRPVQRVHNPDEPKSVEELHSERRRRYFRFFDIGAFLVTLAILVIMTAALLN